MRKKFLATAALGFVSLAVLTGCSGGQSLADACGIAEEHLISTTADLEGSMDGLSTGDFTSAVDAFDELESRLSAATDSISHPEVKAAMGELTDAVGGFGTLMEEAEASSSDPSALLEISNTMQDKVSDIQTAGNDLQELCS